MYVCMYVQWGIYVQWNLMRPIFWEDLKQKFEVNNFIRYCNIGYSFKTSILAV